MKLTASSNITVVVPEAAMRTEEFAAEELCKYLQLIFPGICATSLILTGTFLTPS